MQKNRYPPLLDFFTTPSTPAKQFAKTPQMPPYLEFQVLRIYVQVQLIIFSPKFGYILYFDLSPNDCIRCSCTYITVYAALCDYSGTKLN